MLPKNCWALQKFEKLLHNCQQFPLASFPCALVFIFLFSKEFLAFLSVFSLFPRNVGGMEERNSPLFWWVFLASYQNRWKIISGLQRAHMLKRLTQVKTTSNLHHLLATPKIWTSLLLALTGSSSFSIVYSETSWLSRLTAPAVALHCIALPFCIMFSSVPLGGTMLGAPSLRIHNR